MSGKTLEEYKTQELIDIKAKEERCVSDKTYARKLAETIIFTFVGMVLIAFIGALIKFVIR